MITPIKLPKKKYIETIFQRKGEVTSIKKTEGFWIVDVVLNSTGVIFGTYNAFTLISAEPNSGVATYQANNEKVEMYMDAGIIY
tara:strand:+ start:1001 stop:1252 length:252 start_codon:yes stop_codon:yes gene_type:complete